MRSRSPNAYGLAKIVPGSLTIFAAMHRASLRVSRLAAETVALATKLANEPKK